MSTLWEAVKIKVGETLYNYTKFRYLSMELLEEIRPTGYFSILWDVTSLRPVLRLLRWMGLPQDE